MNEIEQLINEFTREYHGQKKSLIRLKIVSFIFLIIGFCFGLTVAFNKRSFRHISLNEKIFAESITFIFITLPLILAPLYIFMDDKIQSRIIYKIKYAIFNELIHKYGITYQYSPKNKLPDSDIRNLKMENKILTFAYGDDLLFGNVNENTKFKISEIHSTGLFFRKFDGLIGVLEFSDSSELVLKYEHISKFIDDNIYISKTECKIYICLKGRKRHFEFKFKREKPNINELMADKVMFEKLCNLMF